MRVLILFCFIAVIFASRDVAIPLACLEEKEVGVCKASFPRYYYNQKTGECEQFIYGGCGGNSNNFEDKEDCEAVCKN